jgi:nicotinate-nucleotide adenylyltransferase
LETGAGRDGAVRGRVGVLGGTFDPIHVGHLVAAEGVRCDLALDRVIFVPAARPPHKDAVGITDAAHRAAMVREAVADNPAFEVSDLEIRRGGTSYTIDTIREFMAGAAAGTDLFFLMGGDSLMDIRTWRDYESLLAECTVVVFPRPGMDLTHVDEWIRSRVRVVPTHLVDVASRDIRERVQQGRSIRYLVTARVQAYIEEHGLYR